MGETKFKILAIICNCEAQGTSPSGYQIWKSLQQQFGTYTEKEDLRNVYHHLKGLCDERLVNKTEDKAKGTPLPRQLYSLTDRGKMLEDRFRRFLEI